MKRLSILLLLILVSACTQESQNQISRSLKNWTGTNSVFDIYMGEKRCKRCVAVWLATATLA